MSSLSQILTATIIYMQDYPEVFPYLAVYPFDNDPEEGWRTHGIFGPMKPYMSEGQVVVCPTAEGLSIDPSTSQWFEYPDLGRFSLFANWGSEGENPFGINWEGDPANSSSK